MHGLVDDIEDGSIYQAVRLKNPVRQSHQCREPAICQPRSVSTEKWRMRHLHGVAPGARCMSCMKPPGWWIIGDNLWRRCAAPISLMSLLNVEQTFRGDESLGIRLIPAGRLVADSLNISAGSGSSHC